ncbi:MAG TPA: phytanoyl-CoA dioxygenase family protein [Acidimicrobiales bacterium]|nr:phytanoyl-CoA dioxygenase family protein [Acidimicrobiales bacterium]
MRSTPTEQEKAFYEENGFVSIVPFLSGDELGQWRTVVDQALAERGGQRFAFPVVEVEDEAVLRRSSEEREYYDRVFTQRVNLWQTSAPFRELLHQPELGRFVGQVAGVEGLRIWHDQALVKEPYGNPTAFHLDVPYWSFTSPDAITIWIALDDATLQNGCLYYVAGSHKAQKFDNVPIGRELGALFDVYPEWRDVAATPCPVPAGGALLHNGLIFHGAGANMTPGRRRAITCAYMPDGSTFNGQQNVLPPEYFRTLAVGDVLDYAAQNPLVYRRGS